eukprot:scaffold1728_cov116-Isochrysis_galbana.AAC.4
MMRPTAMQRTRGHAWRIAPVSPVRDLANSGVVDCATLVQRASVPWNDRLRTQRLARFERKLGGGSRFKG